MLSAYFGLCSVHKHCLRVDFFFLRKNFIIKKDWGKKETTNTAEKAFDGANGLSYGTRIKMQMQRSTRPIYLNNCTVLERSPENFNHNYPFDRRERRMTFQRESGGDYIKHRTTERYMFRLNRDLETSNKKHEPFRLFFCWEGSVVIHQNKICFNIIELHGWFSVFTNAQPINYACPFSGTLFFW